MTSRRLALFDIDGTLTATNEVDDECYTEAVAAELGVSASQIDWSDAPHITDTGIARWLWTWHRERLPTETELYAIKARFVTLLHERFRSQPDRFLAVAGAAQSLPRLRADGWALALATGGWGESARMKLRAARLPIAMPLFCSDHAFTREQIIALAWEHAARSAGGPFERVVSIGDGVWDLTAASILDMPFVGVGVGAKAHRLSALGASHVLEHLQYHPLRESLESCRVPGFGSDAPGRHNEELNPTGALRWRLARVAREPHLLDAPAG
jgi:phosphoglycolate phosphatase-like HAD superfamily hydrolase